MKVLLGIAVVVALFWLRSRYERVQLTMPTRHIYSPKLGKVYENTTFLFLTDLHNNTFGGKDKLAKAILESGADALLIGGDSMVVKEWQPMDFHVIFDLLDRLEGKMPVYYANGNHEQRMREEKEQYPGWYEAFKKGLHDRGVIYLEDETALFTRPGGEDTPILIGGLDLESHYYQKGKTVPMEEGYVEKHLGKKKEGFSILMAHSPLYFQAYQAWGADLTLAGHFHGGTIRLPGWRGLMSPQFHFFPRYGYGVFQEQGHVMVVSAGLGTHSINIRLGDKPELVGLVLHPGETPGEGVAR